MSPRTAPRLVGRERELAATIGALHRDPGDEGGRHPTVEAFTTAMSWIAAESAPLARA